MTSKFSLRISILAMLCIPIVFLSGCNQTKAPSVSLTKSKQERPQAMMTRVAKQVQACWFKKKHPAFRKYKMATELNSFSGKPRILIVPRNNPAGLPHLVAQAERRGGRNQFTTFGPLLNSKQGSNLAASLNSWARGRTSC
ncbi:MAG: hypothetical protein V3V04_05715 [Rhizobiaceae bacterium]